MRLGLFFNHSDTIRGPQKVANNLMKGLKSIGVDFYINEQKEINGCLQAETPQYRSLPRSTLMGPNLIVTPDQDNSIWSIYSHFVVPCEWVLKKYRDFKVTNNAKINVWSVGIDTETFTKREEKKEFDCLLYVKNRSGQEIAQARDFLKSKKITYKEIHYGAYLEEQLISLIHKCRFCFLLTHTESQGIAYMEILSSGLPCFVWNKNNWNGYPATSVPYFDFRCGEIVEKLETSIFDKFMSNLDGYNPRDYVTSEHTLEISAKKYMDLVGTSHSLIQP